MSLQEIEAEIDYIVDMSSFRTLKYYNSQKILRNHRRGYFHNGDHEAFISKCYDMTIDEAKILMSLYRLNKHKNLIPDILQKDKYTLFLDVWDDLFEEGFSYWDLLLVASMSKPGPKYINPNWSYYKYLIEKEHNIFVYSVYPQTLSQKDRERITKLNRIMRVKTDLTNP